MKNMRGRAFRVWIAIFGFGLWLPDVSAQDSLWEKYVSDAQKVQEQGLHDLAVGIYQLALKEAERFGEQDPRLAETLNSLASLYYEQGKYSQAESLYRRSLGLVEEVWGEGHPNVAVSLENIALLYLVQGRYSEAEPLFQHSLTIREKVMGAEHPTVAETLNKLALVYHRQNRYSEAEPFYQRALAIREKAHGEEHPTVAGTLNNLAALYQRQEKSSISARWTSGKRSMVQSTPRQKSSISARWTSGKRSMVQSTPTWLQASTTWACSTTPRANTRKRSRFTSAPWPSERRSLSLSTLTSEPACRAMPPCCVRQVVVRRPRSWRGEAASGRYWAGS